MTNINDIPEGEHRERLRAEILGNVQSRASRESEALNRLVSYMGIVCSGSTIAILSFLAQLSEKDIPLSAIFAFLSSSAALLSFAVMLYLQYQLHAARWNSAADLAEGFFSRRMSLEDVLQGQHAHQSVWKYRLLFWMPFGLLFLAFTLGAAAILQVAQRPALPQPHVQPIEIKIETQERGKFR